MPISEPTTARGNDITIRPIRFISGTGIVPSPLPQALACLGKGGYLNKINFVREKKGVGGMKTGDQVTVSIASWQSTAFQIILKGIPSYIKCHFSKMMESWGTIIGLSVTLCFQGISLTSFSLPCCRFLFVFWESINLSSALKYFKGPGPQYCGAGSRIMKPRLLSSGGKHIWSLSIPDMTSSPWSRAVFLSRGLNLLLYISW